MTDTEYKQWLVQPSSIRVMLVEVVVNIANVETTLYLSNRPYVSNLNVAYDPCIEGGISVTENLSFDGTASSGFGDIEINNVNGDRDDWLNHVWANRNIAVYLGDVRWPKADFRKIFDGVVHDIGSSSRNNLVVTLLNKLDRLNNPALEAKLGGSSDKADTLLPVVLGEVHNIEPLLIDANAQTYMAHNGPMERVIEVRDNGAPRSDITPNLATGKFTVSTAAVIGQITASIQGAVPDGAYTNNIATLIKYLVKSYGPAALRFTDADIDLTNFNAFAAAHTQPVGTYITGTDSVLAIAQMLAASVGAQVVATAVGKLRLVQMALPPVGTPVVVDATDMDYQSLRIAERTEVAPTSVIAYCKNWTVQSSGMATGLPASSASLFAKEWLTETVSDAGVTSKYRLTVTPEQTETMLLRKADAIAEATRRSNLWKTPRTVYEAVYGADMLLTELGDAITIKHPRYGMAVGKTGMVVSISRDWLKGRITLGVLI